MVRNVINYFREHPASALIVLFFVLYLCIAPLLRRFEIISEDDISVLLGSALFITSGIIGVIDIVRREVRLFAETPVLRGNAAILLGVFLTIFSLWMLLIILL